MTRGSRIASLTGVGMAVAAAAWLTVRHTGAQAPEAATRPQPFATEQEWIVREVVRAVAAGAAAASAGADVPAPEVRVRTRPASELDLLNAASLDVEVGASPAVTVIVREHVWSPQTYTDLAATLLSAATGSRDPSRAPTDSGDGAASALQALAGPRTSAMLAEEARVTLAIKAAPLDPGPREDAALLAAVLAIRESAGWFADHRPLLCRATAHLSLAAALRRGRASGPSGTAAAIAIDVLAGREDLALPRLDAWTRADRSSAAACWQRALRLRATGDWRQVTLTPTSALLERLEYARALRERVGSNPVLTLLEEHPEFERTADWHRMVLHDTWIPFNVEAGHQFAESGLDSELEELTEVWHRYHQGNPARDTLIASLDEPATGPYRYRAIDWDAWAGFFERHICAQLRAGGRHIRNLGYEPSKEGWPDTAKPFRSLRLFPFVSLLTAMNEQEYGPASVAARQVFAVAPALFTARFANAIQNPPSFVKNRQQPPNDVAWFTPHVPTGTTFDAWTRTLGPGCKRPVPQGQVERWTKQAPHDFWVSYSLNFVRTDAIPTIAEGRRALGDLLDYDLRALRRVFQYMDGNGDDYIPIAKAMCRLEANECGKLGAELLWNAREKEAAEVFETYARTARDSVGISNDSDWLVRYWWDTGRRDRALALATDNRHVGSRVGLETYGFLMARQGRDAEALEAFEESAQHYRAKSALASYYLYRARKTADQAWVSRAAAAVPEIFPQGIERADGAWLPAPPPDGVMFLSYGPRAARTGFQPDDVIVAVEGYRVHSMEQYNVVMYSDFEERVPVKVWRKGRYQTFEATIPQRRMGVGLATYPSAAKRRIWRK
jgi:hypothetical protein